MSATQTRPTRAALEQFAKDWYTALDRHDPLEQVTAYLAEDGLVMNFPEGTSRGLAAFADWYDKVTRTFFDEEHTVTSVEIDRVEGTRTVLKVVVNWQTKVWNPPQARSVWKGFDAYQTWTVDTAGATPRILTYTVDALTAMPGSPQL
ncbi:nuclear transport factor 2 family protein [Kitasatospora sp. NPDC093558]|uniref:nuclear transport factor 2 family protein n=1 Tax=Kitasatospora sp. NPDC093558 TaxID=3155201 RepID=UPI003431AC30